MNKFVNYISYSETLFGLVLQVRGNVPLSEIYTDFCSEFKDIVCFYKYNDNYQGGNI